MSNSERARALLEQAHHKTIEARKLMDEARALLVPVGADTEAALTALDTARQLLSPPTQLINVSGFKPTEGMVK